MSEIVTLRNKKTGETIRVRRKTTPSQPTTQVASKQTPSAKKPRTVAERILPQLITGAEFERGERTVSGDIFERPGAAIRSGIQSATKGEGFTLGFQKGALVPEEVPFFQEQALEKFAPKTGSVLLNFIGGIAPSTIGLAADIATSPADVLLMLLGNAKFKGNIKTPGKSIQGITNKHYIKAVKPSAGKIKGFRGIEKSKRGVAIAVDSILDNAGDLQFVDDATGKAVRRLPENLDEFSSAIRQSKKGIYAKYNALQSEAGKTGRQVDLSSIADDLVDSVAKSSVGDLAPGTEKYAMDMALKLEKRKFLNLDEAQDWVELLNQRLKSFYANPTPDEGAKRVLDAKIANHIRKQLDNIVDSLKDNKFSALKKQYGALSGIENDVAKAAFRNAKRSAKGLVDFTDVFTVSEIVSGLATFSPGRVLRGTVGLGLKSVYNFLNKPNRSIKIMFQEAAKSKSQAVRGLLQNLIRKSPATLPGATRALSKNRK